MARLTGAVRPKYPGSEHFAHAGRPNTPVTSISAQDAEAFCAYLGKRLPTADEWIKAARGGITIGGEPNPYPRRSFPWGPEDDPRRANLGDQDDGYLGVAPAGSFPRDQSPYGVLDLAGNVREWTASEATEAGLVGLRVVMGGDAFYGPAALHHATSFNSAQEARYIDFVLGFRCARGEDGGS
jgi:serine/threonine-protein kinase